MPALVVNEPTARHTLYVRICPNSGDVQFSNTLCPLIAAVRLLTASAVEFAVSVCCSAPPPPNRLPPPPNRLPPPPTRLPPPPNRLPPPPNLLPPPPKRLPLLPENPKASARAPTCLKSRLIQSLK